MNDRWGVEKKNDPRVIVEQMFNDLAPITDPYQKKNVLMNWVLSIIAHAKLDEDTEPERPSDHVILRKRVERIEHYLDETYPGWSMK